MREYWASLTDAQRADGFALHDALVEALNESGEMVVSEALADPSQVRTVSVRDGQTSTDGPFAEAKEHLAGFYLVECDDMDRAVQIAARIPEAGAGARIEVRPVLARGGPQP